MRESCACAVTEVDGAREQRAAEELGPWKEKAKSDCRTARSCNSYVPCNVLRVI